MSNEEIAGQLQGGDSRKLPLELAELLTPPLEHALNHPLRREILRALNESGESRTATELVTASLPRSNVTLVNYHASVLESADLLRIADDELAGERPGRRYASTSAEDVRVRAVLDAMASLDRPDA